jgi:hypothetical protein
MTDLQKSVAKPTSQVPEKKRTAAGLYVTAREAFEMRRSDPKRVKILDVRTPEEYFFVGHAEMARNIPIGFMKYQWNAEKNEPVLESNVGFKRAYNVIDGMEGDLVNDPGSANHGKRMKNGRKNSGAPWTYDVDPALLWISARRAGDQSHGEPN